MAIIALSTRILHSFSGEQTWHSWNSDFEVKSHHEDQHQSIPQTIGISTKVFCTSGPNLVILAWRGDKLWHRHTQGWRTHRHTDRRRQWQHMKAKTDLGYYPTLARELQGFRVWGKFVFRTLELTDTPTNLANQVKVGHALDQSRSVQSRGPERAHQNNEPSWRSLRTDHRLSRQFWDD